MHIKKYIFTYEPICILATKIILNNNFTNNNIAKYPLVFIKTGKNNAKDFDNKTEFNTWKTRPDAGGRAGRTDVAYTFEMDKNNVMAADETRGINIKISYGFIVGWPSPFLFQNLSKNKNTVSASIRRAHKMAISKSARPLGRGGGLFINN